MPNWSFAPSTVAAFGLGGLAVGGGARLTKYLADVLRDQDEGTPVTVKKQTVPISQIPVEVSKEEAEELERKGIRVQRKQADFLPGMALGALGVGAAYGGWKLLDDKMDANRAKKVEDRLTSARQRLEALLQGQPQSGDIKLAAAMKAAEDVYFSKTADLFTGFLNTVDDAVPVAAPILGGLGLAGIIAGFNRAKATNRYEGNAKAIRKAYIENRKTETPYVSMVPVLRDEPGDKAGSPAEQAQKG